MNSTKKLLLHAIFLTVGLQAGQQAMQLPQINQKQIDTSQDQAALNILKAMQDCIKFNNAINWKLYGINAAKYYLKTDVQEIQPGTSRQEIIKNNQNGIAVSNNFDSATEWSKASALYHKYIDELRAKYNNFKRPELKILPEINKDADLKTRLTIQSNQVQFLFARLLDEYIAHLGQVYEKQSGILGLYRNSYYISSYNDQALSITPNEYNELIAILENAAKQPNWGKEINLNLIIIQENKSTISKSLTLNEIINAIKQVPLPVQYSTAAKIGAGVVAAAALGAGAYLAYQASSNGEPMLLPALTQEVNDIEQKLDTTALPATTEKNNNIEPNDHNVINKNRPYDLFTAKDDDNALQEVGKSIINDITNLPADIAHRAAITWNNVSSGNYKPGQTTKESLNKYVNAADTFAYDSVNSSFEDPALQPLDEGDMALIDSAGALYNAKILGGLAKSVANKTTNLARDTITRGTAQGVTEGIANFEKTGMSYAAQAESQAASQARQTATQNAAQLATQKANLAGAKSSTTVADIMTNTGNSLKNSYGAAKENLSRTTENVLTGLNKNINPAGYNATEKAAQAQQYATTTAKGYNATQGIGATMQEGNRYNLSQVKATQAAADNATKIAAQTGLNPYINKIAATTAPEAVRNISYGITASGGAVYGPDIAKDTLNTYLENDQNQRDSQQGL